MEAMSAAAVPGAPFKTSTVRPTATGTPRPGSFRHSGLACREAVVDPR
jgi:hypothetical protein